MDKTGLVFKPLTRESILEYSNPSFDTDYDPEHTYIQRLDFHRAHGPIWPLKCGGHTGVW